jgi:hypothetical protein
MPATTSGGLLPPGVAWSKRPGFFSKDTLKHVLFGGNSIQSLLQTAVTVLTGEVAAKIVFNVADALASIHSKAGQEQRMMAESASPCSPTRSCSRTTQTNSSARSSAE